MELHNDSDKPLEVEMDGKRVTIAPGESVVLSNVLHIRFIPPGKPKRKKAQASLVNERLKAVIMEAGVDEKDIVPSAYLVEDLDIDSIGLVEFFMALEEEFDLHITDSDAEKMMTVGEIEAYLHNKGVI